MNRRDFLKGIAGILAASTAPAFVRAQSLMPVRPLPSGLVIPLSIGRYQGGGGVLSIYTGSGETLAEMALEDGDFEIVRGVGCEASRPEIRIRNARHLSLDIKRSGVADSFSIQHPFFVVNQKLQVAGSNRVVTGEKLHFFPEVKLSSMKTPALEKLSFVDEA